MDIVIIGTGGMAKELWGMLRQMGCEIMGFVGAADAPSVFMRLPVIGTDADFYSERPQAAVIANGSPLTRRRIAEFYHGCGHRWPALIHPAAHVFDNVTWRGGCTIMPGGVIMADTTLGRFVHINMGVTIGHDCKIGDYSVINHNAGVSGGVTIGEAVLIGAGATILENVTIGDGAIVGAGAVVTKDIPAGECWIGVPARKLR